MQQCSAQQRMASHVSVLQARCPLGCSPGTSSSGAGGGAGAPRLLLTGLGGLCLDWLAMPDALKEQDPASFNQLVAAAQAAVTTLTTASVLSGDN